MSETEAKDDGRERCEGDGKIGEITGACVGVYK
jgi:hypothetical protein